MQSFSDQLRFLATPQKQILRDFLPSGSLPDLLPALPNDDATVPVEVNSVWSSWEPPVMLQQQQFHVPPVFFAADVMGPATPGLSAGQPTSDNTRHRHVPRSLGSNSRKPCAAASVNNKVALDARWSTEILDMPTADLNRLLRDCTAMSELDKETLREARRRRKNRAYARKSRSQRSSRLQQLAKEREDAAALQATLEAELTRVHEENVQLRQRENWIVQACRAGDELRPGF